MKPISIYHLLQKKITSNFVIKGTIILVIAGFATRIIGFYNRIFLSGLIGATELGIYQLILPLYMIAFAFTNYGNELALTKLVSEYKSRNEYGSVQAFFRVCFVSNLTLALFTATIMYQNADWICVNILKAPACTSSIKIICLGIPFMAMKGCIHGYFLGLEKSSIRGVSDFIEQLAKILGIYLLATYICIRNDYDANFALWGVVIGDAVAFLYSICILLYHNHKNQALFKTHDVTIYPQKAIALFFQNAIPLTTNRLALTILQSMESIMIPSVLLMYYHDSNISLAHYGTFTGMAFPFIMFPATITNALSTMLLPAVSSAKSSLNQMYLTKLCEKSLHFCLLIGIFSFIAFYTYGADIGILLFQNKEAGIYLYQLSFLCPLIYLATTLASVINGLGCAPTNLLFTVIATIIRISFILFTTPKLGIAGYIIGLFASYLFLTFACLHKVQQYITFQLYFMESIFLPGCIFTILGAISYYIYQKMLPIIPTRKEQIVLLLGIILIWGIISFPPMLKSIYKVRQQPH